MRSALLQFSNYNKSRISDYWTVLITIFLLSLTGCIFGALKEEIKEGEHSSGLVGQIIDIADVEGDVIILLYAREKGQPQLNRYTLPDENGRFSFLVTPGDYMVAGFEDRNNNQRHDPGEPAGAWGTPDIIRVSADQDRKPLPEIALTFTAGGTPVKGIDALAVGTAKLSPSLAKLGVIASWDDPTFDESHGSTGYWKPITFLKQIGTGIYFMAPYDRKKIPILFIHGATGTPRGWKAMADSLDGTRFQPWVFYYPSGLALNDIATYLNEMIKGMQARYAFERMGVVAHSMGGLVSRSFIVKHLVEDGLSTVRVFVSFSTPWGGVKMAAKGVEHAPVAVPSWHDVAPQSDFLQYIFAEPLNPQVSHYLVFSYRGDSSFFMANNDGTVELSSQLDIRAQDDARKVWGLDEDHVSILTSPKAFEYMNKAIEMGFSENTSKGQLLLN